MTGHRPFAELRRKLPAPRRHANAAATKKMLRELALFELRAARDVSQANLARTLKVGQPAVAKLERRADIYVSNLRRYIEAMGGTLRIVAEFPDGDVSILTFGEIGRARSRRPRRQSSARAA
jgi:hypothetical protein